MSGLVTAPISAPARPPNRAPLPALPAIAPRAAPVPAPSRPPETARSGGVVPQAASERLAVSASGNPADFIHVFECIIVSPVQGADEKRATRDWRSRGRFRRILDGRTSTLSKRNAGQKSEQGERLLYVLQISQLLPQSFSFNLKSILRPTARAYFTRDDMDGSPFALSMRATAA